MISLLVNAPRWLFLAALVFAPWAYGSTRQWAMLTLDGILGVVILLWLAGCVARKKRPVVPWLLTASAVILLLQGWFMFVNVQAAYDPVYFRFIPAVQLVPFAPGDVDRQVALPTLLNVSAMLGAICFVADLAQRSVWRTRLWWTAGLNGILLMICGLWMKISGIYIMSSLNPTEVGWDCFAFFFYHGNAGAFINLILPLVGGLAGLAFIRNDAQMERALWLPGLLICIASSEAALSKAGMVIGLALLIALTVWFVRLRLGSGRVPMSRTQMWLLVAAWVLGVGAMLSSGWHEATRRWADLATASGTDGSVVQRLLVSQVCFHMMPDSGFWGFGPGSFVLCFPHYAAYLNGAVDGIWYYAHEDYLQTIVEWGYFGSAFLAVILFGGIWMGWRRLCGKPLAEPDRVLVTMALFALAGIVVHASFDFPLQIPALQLYVATYLGICWGSPGFALAPAPIRHRRSLASQPAIRVPNTGAV